MCLLVINRKETKFSDKFLDGVYQRNSDGIGVMYAEDGVLHVKRMLPENASEARSFYRKHAEGKDCVVHWRLMTHGYVTIENCHPYEVFGDGSEHPIYMAHNGILSTGNQKDVSRSDTYWYIEDFIKPLAKANPEIVFTEAFIRLISGHIGHGNKFAFMNHMGQIAVCNESAFTEYEGSLLSNTYAWDYYGLHPKAPRQQAFSYPTSNWKKTSWVDSYLKDSPKGKKTIVQPAYNPPKGVTIPVKDRVQKLMDDLQENYPDVADELTFMQVTRAYHKCGWYDVDDLVELMEDGYISQTEFIEAIKEPEKITEIINASFEQELKDDAKLDVGLI